VLTNAFVKQICEWDILRTLLPVNHTLGFKNIE
jgi:hypothetical protein